MPTKTNKKARVYLDYCATTPVDPRVSKYMYEFMQEKFGNPSSIHTSGREVRDFIDEARDFIREYIGADEPTEVIFTSGGTESDNLAIRGVVAGSKIKKPHIITTVIEHKAVLTTIQELEKNGVVEATYLKVNHEGEIDIEELKKNIKYNTVLVSIMYANNEIGTIEPIREVGKYLEKLNSGRVRAGFPQVYLHTDAVQAFSYLNTNVKHLHVDLMSVSSHKICGPKGVGMLYVKKGTLIKSINTGGAQEFGVRGGTENTIGIAGFYKAVEILKSEREKEAKKIEKMRDTIIGKILKIPEVELTGHKKNRLPGVASFVFHKIEGESISINLDLEGIAVSTGSACTSGSLQPSHVLMACGFDPEAIQGNIRISIGRFTEKSDIDVLIKVLPGIIKRLRDMSPL